MAASTPTARTAIAQYDVVIEHVATNDLSVGTTTTEGDHRVAGVAAEAAAIAETLIVQSDGDKVIVNVLGAVSRGDWLITSTTAGKAIAASGWQHGVFARARSDSGTPGAGTCYCTVAIGWNSAATLFFDELHIDYVAPADAFSEFAALDIELNVDDLAASSEVHAIIVAPVGSTTGEVAALGVYTGADVIHQHIGTFVQPDQTTPDAYAGEIPDGGAWSDGLDGKTVFEDDDDEIYVGDAAKFSELEVILGTNASHDETLVWEFYDTSPAWIPFVPLDGTNGFRQTGLITWNSVGLTNWKNNHDPGGGDTAPGYWIRARRTRNNVLVDPIITTLKLLEPTMYSWNSDGSLEVTDITMDDGVADSPVFAQIDADAEQFTIQKMDTGQAILKNSEDNIDLQPNNDGANYMRFQTLGGVAGMHAVGGNLKLTAAAGTIMLDNENLTTTGDLTCASVIPSSAAFPVTPAAGEIFYHTTHDTLFLYEGAWKPIINYGATLALYVDDGAGTDAIGKGYGAGANAVATIQYAWDNLVPAIFNGVITINITAVIYVEEIALAGKTPGSSMAEVILLGTLPAAEDTGTADADSTTTALEDDGQAWGAGVWDDFLLIITGGTGAGQEIWIDTNDADTITPAGLFNPAPAGDSTYAIYDPSLGTRVAPGGGNTAFAITNQKSVTVKYIEVTGGFRGFNTMASTGITLQTVSMDTTTQISAFVDSSAVTFNTFQADGCWNGIAIKNNSSITVNSSFLHDSTVFHGVDVNGGTAIFNRNMIDANADNGVLARNNGYAQFNPGANLNIIKNHNGGGEYGIYAETGGQVKGAGSPTYVNNTVDWDDDSPVSLVCLPLHATIQVAQTAAQGFKVSFPYVTSIVGIQSFENDPLTANSVLTIDVGGVNLAQTHTVTATALGTRLRTAITDANGKFIAAGTVISIENDGTATAGEAIIYLEVKKPTGA